MAKRRHGRVAVITAKADAHVPFVQEYLDDPIIVLDPQDLLDGKSLTYTVNDGAVAVEFDNVMLSNVIGVWYRKPLPILRRDLPVKDDYKLYSQNAIERHAYLWLSAFADAKWVSDYYALSRATNKTLQMAVAQRIGLQVPDTIITSDPEMAKRFIERHVKVVAKPLTASYPTVKGRQTVLLTNLIDENFVPDLTYLQLAPSIFQTAINVSYEARVIVVGDLVYAAMVRSDADESDVRIKHVRDNRIGHYSGSVSIEALADLPKEIAAKSVEHCKVLDLAFGALDFIVDTKGSWWFLENNPNGQWAYIEQATGQPIGKSLAELLREKK